jgi:hypothetical protein
VPGFGINTTRIPGTYNSEGDLLSIAQGEDGELYAMFLNGQIMRIAAPLPVLAGDYNDNGIVDAADYTVWRDKLGSTDMLPNDLVGGTIGAAHYEQWTSNFGESNLPHGSGATSAVPEPSAIALALFPVLALIARSRRHRN